MPLLVITWSVGRIVQPDWRLSRRSGRAAVLCVSPCVAGGTGFLPFLRWRGIAPKVILMYMAVGACQLGIMYLFVFHAYNHPDRPGILLFTVLTPCM